MAAASSVMEKRPLIREGGKEVEDMLREEWVGVWRWVWRWRWFSWGVKGPGGGGGYSGGSGSANKDNSCGGGGRFFNNGTNQENEYCCNSDEHGKVIIAFLR